MVARGWLARRRMGLLSSFRKVRSLMVQIIWPVALTVKFTARCMDVVGAFNAVGNIGVV